MESFESDEFFGDDSELEPDTNDNSIQKLVSVDDLFGRAHRANILAAHFTGQLGSYLYALGYHTSDEVTEVEQRLEQLIPTYEDQTIEKLALLEIELSQNLFGGANRIIIGYSDEGDVMQDIKVFNSVTKRAEALVIVMQLMLDVRKTISKSL